MSWEALLQPALKMQDLPSTEAFADLRAHVARLDLPDGETVDWSQVQRVATTLLIAEGKDLLLATYAAFAPLALGGVRSPHQSIAFLQQFMERYWDTMSPPVARSRARANSIAWFVTRLRVTLPALLPTVSDKEKRQSEQAWRAFSTTVAERLGAAAPSTYAVSRLFDAPSQHPKPQTAQGSSPTAPLVETPSILVQAMDPPQLAGQDCQTLARSLCLLAKQRRQSDAADLQACRLWRVGLWLNVHTAPALLGDVTRVVGVPAAIRARLTQAQRCGQWPVLYALAEDTMFAHPLCLDLQYYAAEALSHMGDAHRALAALVLFETQALCRRVPELVSLHAADGSALAMRETQVWLSLQTPQGPAPPCRSDAPLKQSARARRRFYQKLAHAQTCIGQGHIDAAEAAYDGLMRDVRRHKLDIWEPGLARLVAKGHFDALLRQVPPELPRVRRAYRLWTALDADGAQREALRMAALQSAP